jgi:hypothetical protein
LSKDNEFMIYELLAIAGSTDPELDLSADDARLSKMIWAASDCFERGDVVEAARRYQEILEVFPNDPVAKVMLYDLSPTLHPETPAKIVDD